MRDATKFWDGTAVKYAKSPIKDMDSYQYTLERTISYLKPEHRALELGCGTGSTALLLAPHVKHITATDISPNMVAIGRQKARDAGVENIDLHAADIYDALIDGPYDVVLGHNLFHLIPDTPKVMRRMFEMVTPGGLFISKTFCRPNKWEKCGPMLGYMGIRAVLPLMQLIGKAPYVNFMRISELEQAVTAAGFEIVETGNYPVAPPSRYIVARKPA